MLGDIENPRWMYVKGALLILIGLLACVLLLLEHFSWRSAALLAVAIWAFCRAYYFAFYVIERYVDRSILFAGNWSIVRCVAGGKAKAN